MDKKELHPLLPPDYVSLAQLRERWLEKQREKEMREKQKDEEQEKKEIDAVFNENQKQRRYLLKSDWRVKHSGGGYRRDRGVTIEEKGKGKEIDIGGSENKKKKKKKKRNFRRKQKYENGNLNNNKEFSGPEEPKIITENEEKVENKGILCGENSGDGVFHGLTEEIPKRKEFRGGFLRNFNNGVSRYVGKRENWAMIVKDTKVELALEKNRDETDVLKGNVELGKKVDENLDVHSEIVGLERECSFSNDKRGERRFGNAYINWRGNNGRRFGGLAFNDPKVNSSRRCSRPGRFEGVWKIKERNMMWVKKEDKLGDGNTIWL